MKVLIAKYLLSSILFIAFFAECKAETTLVLPSVFSDDMVLQQKTNAAIWGTTKAGKTVKISTTWSSKTYTTKADLKGDWKIFVATPSYGGPYRIDISDGTLLSLKNVLIGEVWICSGQSNMEMPLVGWGKINHYQKELEEANYPKIRLLNVAHVTSNLPLENAILSNEKWQPCNAKSVESFSSVAYFFARELYKKTGIPIGLIHTSWGGTVAEAWTSGTTLKQMPDFADDVKKIEQTNQALAVVDYKVKLKAWQKGIFAKDSGYVQGKPMWSSTAYDFSNWDNMSLPAYWEEKALPNFDGVVWFKKKIVIPASMEGRELKLSLGTIDDDDVTFFDGQEVGTSEGYNVLRNYTIPAKLATAGAHVITIRVFDAMGNGGIYGNKNVMSIRSANGNLLALDGDWQYKVGLNFKDISRIPPAEDGPNRPSVLYNAMIQPFIQYAISGAIWYQGESNANRADQYKTLFPAMITDWRKKWNRGDFPFYFVQLANYMDVSQLPVPSAWAELRDAQLHTLALPNTGMSVSIDIGEAKDIHPKNKQEVGRRLALIALAKTYGQKVVYSGPVMQSFQVAGDQVKMVFGSAEGGLKAKDGDELKGFAIAGEDKIFYWAKAVIQGNNVTVSSPDVPKPVAVRYAWADNPDCNLYNEAGLPASPFRTDDWAYSTFGKK